MVWWRNIPPLLTRQYKITPSRFTLNLFTYSFPNSGWKLYTIWDFPTKFRLINLWQTTLWRHTQVSLACPPHPLAVLSSPKQTQSSSLIHHSADWTSPSQLGFHPWQFVRRTAQTPTALAFVNMRDMLFSMQYPLMANDSCLGMGKGEVQLVY